LLSKAITPKIGFFKPIPQNDPPRVFCRRFPKVAPQNFYKILFSKIIYKIIPPKIIFQNYQNCFPPNYFSKYLCKINISKRLYIVKNDSSNLFFKIMPEKKIENYSPKLYSENIPQTCSPFKTVIQSCRVKLLLKIISNPQKCFPKLCHKIITQNSSPKLSLPVAPSNYPPKLLKLSQKLFPKATSQIFFLMLFPNISILQNILSSILVQGRVSKKFPKILKLFFEIISNLVRNIDQN
jgi:hypothetical protein